MTTVSEPRVVLAERKADGVFIEFADGKSALFPSSFLFAHLPWYQLDLPSVEKMQPAAA